MKGLPIKENLRDYPYEAMLGAQLAYNEQLKKKHWTEDKNMGEIEKDEVCVFLKNQYTECKKKYTWLTTSWPGMLSEAGYSVVKEMAPSMIPNLAKTANKAIKDIVG